MARNNYRHGLKIEIGTYLSNMMFLSEIKICINHTVGVVILHRYNKATLQPVRNISEVYIKGGRRG